MKDFNLKELKKIEEKCKESPQFNFKLFKDLKDETWAKILFECPDNYPTVKRILPSVVDQELQKKWVGLSESNVMVKSLSIYQVIKKLFFKYSKKLDLEDTKILDFGCGWGRIVRFFLKDSNSENLFGVDPQEFIINKCKESNLKINLAVSDWIPTDLPFPQKFDLIFSFSVFTHLSEKVSQICLETLSNSLGEKGILILTIRPKNFITLRFKEKNYESLVDSFERGCYVFVSQNREQINGEDVYGDSIIPIPYILKNWSTLFEIKEFYHDPNENYMVYVVLQKK